MSPWIIHQKPRRKRQVEERPVLQLPISSPDDLPRPNPEADEDKVERGVAVVDFYI